jgi:outer membrane protein
MRAHAAPAALCTIWIGLTAFAPPDAPILAYAVDSLEGASAAAQPVEPGEQYPAPEADLIPEPPAADPAQAPRPERTTWTLSVDASLLADSNVTNGSDSDTVLIDTGAGLLPVPLDPVVRERSGTGFGLSAAGGLRLEVDKGVRLAADVEAYALEYEGARTDDSGILLAGGAELSGGGDSALVQLIAFERWYGGISAYQGYGIRGRFRHKLAQGQAIALSLEGRVFESDYGEAYGGRHASAYLTYESLLNADLSGSAGLFARREWLETDAYSSFEYGAYAGLTHSLNDDVAVGLSVGLSRLRFDGAIAFLSPDPRSDWRSYGSLYVLARKPVALGITPSLTYTYNRSDSSIDFFRSDRHRLRLGLQRNF